MAEAEEPAPPQSIWHRPVCLMHFTPASPSWMNMVEGFFRDITVDCIRDGSFASVNELKDSILDCLNERNLNPKPYVWKAEGKSILEKIQREKAAMPEHA